MTSKRPFWGHFYLNIAILGQFCSLFWLHKMLMSPSIWFMSWESMIQVHLRHSRALKFIVLGFRNSSIDFKKSHFGSFLLFYANFVPYLLQNMFMIPFTSFMSWELLLQVHWRHYRALKFIILGVWKANLISKRSACQFYLKMLF